MVERETDPLPPTGPEKKVSTRQKATNTHPEEGLLEPGATSPTSIKLGNWWYFY